jgi:hypothetical protein
MSCGSDGKNGSAGKAGAACVPEALADGSGFAIKCGEQTVYTVKNGPKGASGAPGAAGEDCYIETNSTGYDVFCGEEQMGSLYSGVRPDQSEGTGGEFSTENDTLLNITCRGGESNFVMSLCNGRTYNGTKLFCSYIDITGNENLTTTGGELFPRCNKEAYLVTHSYCARNLVVEVERKTSMDASGRVSVTENPVDMDSSDRTSSNWKVMRKLSNAILIDDNGDPLEPGDEGYYDNAAADTCFYQRAGGEPVVKACADFGTTANVVYTMTLSDGTVKNASLVGPYGAGGIQNVCNVENAAISSGVAGSMQSFDLSREKCQSSLVFIPQEGACATILVGENTCYSDGTVDVPAAQAYVKSCLYNGGTSALYYDPNTVVSCDASQKNPELAVVCAEGRIFSANLYQYSVTSITGATAQGLIGSNIGNRISCVKREYPSVCPFGSEIVDSGAKAGTCGILPDYKTPACPTGYYFGGSSNGIAALGVKENEIDEGVIPDNPKDYCVKAVIDAMCPTGTSAVKGRCVLGSTAAVITVPSVTSSVGYTFYSSSGANALASFTGKGAALVPSNYNVLCSENGGEFNTVDGLCYYLALTATNPKTVDADKVTANTKLASCPAGTTMMLTSLQGVNYEIGGKIDKYNQIPLTSATSTVGGISTTVYFPYIATTQSAASEAAANQAAITKGLSYYCVANIGNSEFRCPIGSVANPNGWCEKVLVSASSGVAAVLDTLRPTCPLDFVPMHGNASYAANWTVQETTGTPPIAVPGSYLIGITGFPHLGLTLTTAQWQVDGTTKVKQVCAKKLDDENCETAGKVLYALGANPSDNYPAFNNGSSSGSSRAGYWNGAEGRVCVPNTHVPTGYTVSDPYVCPNPKLTGTGALSIVPDSWSSTSGGTVTNYYGCFINYGNANNGDVLCKEKDKAYEYDATEGACRLTSNLPTCEESNLIGGKTYQFGYGYETSKGQYAQHTFQACAIAIEDEFCPINQELRKRDPNAVLINKVDRREDVNENTKDSKLCIFEDGYEVADCEPGFVKMKSGEVSWCEG